MDVGSSVLDGTIDVAELDLLSGKGSAMGIDPSVS